MGILSALKLICLRWIPDGIKCKGYPDKVRVHLTYAKTKFYCILLSFGYSMTFINDDVIIPKTADVISLTIRNILITLPSFFLSRCEMIVVLFMGLLIVGYLIEYINLYHNDELKIEAKSGRKWLPVEKFGLRELNYDDRSEKDVFLFPIVREAYIKTIIYSAAFLFFMVAIPSCASGIQDIQRDRVLLDAVRREDINEVVLFCDENRFEANYNCFEHFVVNKDKVKSNATPLIIACENGNEEIVRVLESYGADENQIETYNNCSPLLAALNTRNVNRYELANFLISRGADIHYSNGEISALTLACKVYETDDESTKEAGLELFKYLYEQGADTTVYMSQENLLTYAVHYDNQGVVNYLLEREVYDINSFDEAGNTALITAAMYERTEIAELLITYGADKALKDASGKTAYDYAAEQGNTRLMEILN